MGLLSWLWGNSHPKKREFLLSSAEEYAEEKITYENESRKKNEAIRQAVDAEEWIPVQYDTSAYLELTAPPRIMKQFEHTLFDIDRVPVQGMKDATDKEWDTVNELARVSSGRTLRLFHDIYNPKGKFHIRVLPSWREISKNISSCSCGYIKEDVSRKIIVMHNAGFHVLCLLVYSRIDCGAGVASLTIGFCGERSRLKEVPLQAILKYADAVKLSAYGIKTVGDAEVASDADMLAIPGVGKASIAIIRTNLAEHRELVNSSRQPG